MLVVVPPLPLAACSSPSCCGSGLPDARDAKFSEATAAAVQQAQARLGHLHMSGGGSGVGWGGGGGGGGGSRGGVGRAKCKGAGLGSALHSQLQTATAQRTVRCLRASVRAMLRPVQPPPRPAHSHLEGHAGRHPHGAHHPRQQRPWRHVLGFAPQERRLSGVHDQGGVGEELEQQGQGAGVVGVRAGDCGAGEGQRQLEVVLDGWDASGVRRRRSGRRATLRMGPLSPAQVEWPALSSGTCARLAGQRPSHRSRYDWQCRQSRTGPS